MSERRRLDTFEDLSRVIEDRFEDLDDDKVIKAIKLQKELIEARGAGDLTRMPDEELFALMEGEVLRAVAEFRRETRLDKIAELQQRIQVLTEELEYASA